MQGLQTQNKLMKDCINQLSSQDLDGAGKNGFSQMSINFDYVKQLMLEM
jgi:hypothetical protein